MKSFRTAPRRSPVAFIGGLLMFSTAMAQVPASVDIDLADNSSADSLEVRMRSNGTDFVQLVTGLTFTIQWPSSSSVTLGARTLTCPGGVPLMATPQLSDGDFHYATYNAFSTALLSEDCPNHVWPADEWVTVMRVKVNGLTSCTAFNIVNDAWTAANNRNFFLSLNGLERTGTIEATVDSVGSCGEDCLGVQGGADLPGTACDDADVCTTGDTWSVACACEGVYQDVDSDGACDAEDGCPADPNKTAPGICGCGTPDTDTDADATADCLDGCPNDPLKITPGTCGCGTPDTDTDGDLTADCEDGCPEDPLKIAAGFCGCGIPETDSDGDVTPDCVDGCPNDPLKIAPGVCGCGVADTDTDGDLTADCEDGCPNDPEKTLPGVCGCGVPEADTDSDGTPDCTDGCPTDAEKTAPGVCGCNVADTDTDADGTPDCNDGCQSDPDKVEPGTCGCGNPEPGAPCDDGDDLTSNDQVQGDCTCEGTTMDCDDEDPCTADTVVNGVCVNTPLPDVDADGACDLIDGCPQDPLKTSAGACGCGVVEVDTDGDLVADCIDGCPADPLKSDAGICGCGVPDTDTDSDGTADCVDGCPAENSEKIAPGACGCGIADTDTDSDGTADCDDDCPTVPGQIGSACDDGNPNTTDDALNDQCVCTGPPVNDPCFEATVIDVQADGDCPANATIGDNTTATPDAGNTLCDLDGFLHDVWYIFNSGDNQNVTIHIDPGTMSAWGVGIYAECNATELYCEDGTGVPIVYAVTPFTPYLIRIYYNVWFGQGGEHSVCVSAGIGTDVPTNVAAANAWQVFPNPSDGAFQVQNLGAGTDARMELVDVSGRLVFSRSTHVEANGILNVDRRDLSPGLYALRLFAGGNVVEQRVVMH